MHSRTTTSALALAGIALLLTSCGSPSTPEEAAEQLMKEYGKAVSAGDKNALLEIGCPGALKNMAHTDFSEGEKLPKYAFKPSDEIEGSDTGFEMEAESTKDGEDDGTAYFEFEKNSSDEWCISAAY